MRDWAGKRYWVVGGSEGIGREVALGLARLGADVTASARGVDRLDALAAEVPGRLTALPLDVADRAAVEAAAKSLGEVHGLVYLAGLYWPMRAQDWDTDRALAMADVNFAGALRCLGAVLPAMIAKNAGHVVLMGSLSGVRGLPRSVGYGASKAAVIGLAQSLRADLWRTGVQVQVVNPGYVRTRLTAKNDFAMPFLMEPGAAAREVVEHMGGDGFALSFPLGAASAVRMGRVLPEWAYLRLFAR